jgi:hypothetical protein
MTTIGTNAAPGDIQPFRGSQSILCFLILAGISHVGDSMPV